jgi:hypothetical protein
MSQELQVRSELGEIEKVLVTGDLKSLTPEQRTSYYQKVCASLGLNPLTKPFDYLVLNNKLVLYANRNCAEQLRRVYGVSITDLCHQVSDGIVTMIVKGRDAQGREDVASASVVISNLKGEALANAYMKAETKAKRRLTLSMCGLGMLDETEVESIPGAQRVQHDAPAASPAIEAPKSPASTPFGSLVGNAAKENGIALATFINRLHKDLATFYPELADLAGTDWKEKGKALSNIYAAAQQEDREAIDEAIRTVPHLIKEEQDAEAATA